MKDYTLTALLPEGKVRFLVTDLDAIINAGPDDTLTYYYENEDGEEPGTAPKGDFCNWKIET